jgi:large subunit ribosomal protein L25
MEKAVINTEQREGKGKGAARALRRQGATPGVLYREGKSTHIKINHKELVQFLKAARGQQAIISLKFPDGQSKLALMKDYQTDPVTGELLHIDFFEVSMTEKVSVTVPVFTAGEPIGVKRDKGILQHTLREIKIECLPDKITGRIDVDISGLGIGQSVHVSDLKLGEGVKILTDPHEVIATVSAPAVEEEVAAPAAAVAAPAEAAEPEVIKKGKKEEEKAEEKA